MGKGVDRKEAELRLVQKAWNDAEFRKELVADPKAAMQAELGIQFADNVNVVVHEETADTIHLVVPTMPDMGGMDAEVEGQSMSVGPMCGTNMCFTERGPRCR